MQLSINSGSQGGLPEVTQALLLKKALKLEQATQQRLIDSATSGEEQGEPQAQAESSEGETVGRYLDARA